MGKAVLTRSPYIDYFAKKTNQTLPGDKFHEFRNEDEAIDWVSSRLNEHSKTYPLS